MDATDPPLRAKVDEDIRRPVSGDASADGDPASSSTPGGLRPGAVVGRYRLVRQLGAGGMGVVYEAIDERLDRRVALKVIRTGSGDPDAQARLVREARLAARVVDSHVCQIFELGWAGSQPFIAMELVEGESLADRLTAGRLAPDVALRIAVNILDALAVLHDRGLIHRDLKPSNVFLTSAGVKLLDFGLARAVEPIADVTGALTAAGLFVGTPQYASPEQLRGADVDVRSDVFSAAVLIFEMLAGSPPFTGATLAALAHAVMFETPPVLVGAPAIVVADRALHRALAKAPGDRYATAVAFAADLRSALTLVESGQVVEARRILRLAVLPFRQLQPNPEMSYLGPGLADVLAGSLTGLESLVVRSALQSARYGSVPIDLERVATDLAVDVVLTGSLLSTRGRVRVSAELVTVPSGDVWWSHVIEVAPDHVLELHDDLAARVLAALPTSPRDQRVETRVHARSDKAFDLYLRGMQLRGATGAWRQALAYFTQSLELDPTFAAAWAERGRLERILGKYEDIRLLDVAEASLQRALSLESGHGAAQYYTAQLDVDRGRVDTALRRLLRRAWEHRAEPHVFAALVHACRYGGLLEASMEAHRAATRLDPTMPTSVLHTMYMQGAYEQALPQAHQSLDPIEARILGALGRREEAIAAARDEEARFGAVPLLRAFCSGLRAALEGDARGVVATLAQYDAARFSDGEGLFYVAEICALAGLIPEAFATLERAVEAGFLCQPAYERDVYLAPLRELPAWTSLHRRLVEARGAVWREFDQGRGRALLGG
ncbi:MAG: protein kinase [Vicinamibacterales bacterium]